jgi:hypothetical protein
MASKMLMKGMAARRAFSTSKIVNDAAAHSHDDGGWKMWRNFTLFVALPVIVLAHVNVFMPHTHGHKEAVMLLYCYG